jgi:hypothetical protein
MIIENGAFFSKRGQIILISRVSEALETKWKRVDSRSAGDVCKSANGSGKWKSVFV